MHLAARVTSFAVISRTPIAKIGGFKNRMGWSFPWLSSFGTDVDCASDGSLPAPPAIPTAPIALPGVGRLVNGRFPANWDAVGERLELAELKVPTFDGHLNEDDTDLKRCSDGIQAAQEIDSGIQA